MFGINHKELEETKMWEFISKHPSYFLDLEPMPGALEFFQSVQHLDPIILTACPKVHYRNAAQDKRAWVHKHLSRDIMVLPVLGGINKPLFMHSAYDVLIDDWEPNCKAWTSAGGIAILYRGGGPAEWKDIEYALGTLEW
jgi:5'-nucleotidase